MNTGLGYFPLTNHGICKLFAAFSCAALMLLVPTELLLRTAHLKPFAFSLLMPSLCLTIIILVVGDLFVSLAEYAGHKYRHLHGILMGRPSWRDVGGTRQSEPALSESALMRERVSNNVGEAGDEEVSRLAITQRIVVTISADTPIYVVLEQAPKHNQPSRQPNGRSVPTSNSANVEQLRQLLQLQQELNQPTANNQPQ
jgi:hypothetical protein